MMDELLKKYACGIASREEKEEVRNYLAENMSHLQKMIEMMRSIAMQELNLPIESDMLAPEKLAAQHKVPYYAKLSANAVQTSTGELSSLPMMHEVLYNMILNSKKDN
jgi:predicted mannosyl-3-phosphoglycerate phosphatase (HAD superfamily)